MWYPEMFLRLVWPWFKVRCIPYIPENVSDTRNMPVTHIENFLGGSEVKTFVQNQKISEYPTLAGGLIFWKNRLFLIFHQYNVFVTSYGYNSKCAAFLTYRRMIHIPKHTRNLHRKFSRWLWRQKLHPKWPKCQNILPSPDAWFLENHQFLIFG